MKVSIFKAGEGRTGSLAKKDNLWLRENYVEPEVSIGLWVCTNEECRDDNTTATGFLDPHRKRFHKGEVIIYDMRTCPSCGQPRELFAVVSMVKVETDAVSSDNQPEPS